MTQDKGYRPDTLATHSPIPDALVERPMGLPVYRSSTFAFETAADYADTLGNRRPGYTYSRIDNPTVDAFAAGVAALEGRNLRAAVVGQAFASGTAAVATTMMALVSAGDHLVAPKAVYGGTYGLLSNVLTRFGVTVSFVDLDDLAAVEAAITPDTPRRL